MAAELTPQKLFDALLAEEEDNVYVVLDGASVPELLERLHADRSLEVECLFAGNKEPGMAEVAPYLVKLEPQSEFTEWVVGTGWGNHWGTFVSSKHDFHTLRGHLRALTVVHRRDGTPLFFRYYDPRVLRIFMPTCTPAQLKQMFGPVEAFLAEGEAGDAMHIYRFNGEALSSVQRKLV
jgi:hypothetical protein